MRTIETIQSNIEQYENNGNNRNNNNNYIIIFGLI